MPLGDGGLNLPFEENPEPFEVDMMTVVCGGCVVVAASVEVEGEPQPCLIFRFVLPDGDFLPPVALVATAEEILSFHNVVRDSGEAAVRGAEKMRQDRN